MVQNDKLIWLLAVLILTASVLVVTINWPAPPTSSYLALLAIGLVYLYRSRPK